MFNVSGGEIVVILLLALVILGPEKLPEALRRAGRTYAELKKMGNSFQTEMRSVLDEPMKEMRDTADLLRKAVDVTVDTATTDTRAAQPATPVEPAVVPSRPPVVEQPSPAVDATRAADAAPATDGLPAAEVAPAAAATRPAVEATAAPAPSDPVPAPDAPAPTEPSAAVAAVPPPDAVSLAPAPTPEDELINRTLAGDS